MSKNNNITDRVNSSVKSAKKVAKTANDNVYNTTQDVVDFSIKRGAEWQGVTEKAIKGGLKLAANQQDILFDTLFTVKSHIKHGRKRFSALFSNN